MPRTQISGSFGSPKVGLIVDLGNPFLNQTVDSFLKIGGVAIAKAAADETYHIVKRGSVSNDNLQNSLKKMCKEGAYWGTVAGLYVGMEYGAERIFGVRDWKNSLISGALTGATMSAASSNKAEKIVLDAITGGAVATAAHFLNYNT